MANIDPLLVWIRMDDSVSAKSLMKVAVLSRYINAKWLARWCLNCIATKHTSVQKKPPDAIDKNND